jgi:hypothetical protein
MILLEADDAEVEDIDGGGLGVVDVVLVVVDVVLVVVDVVVVVVDS